MKKCILIINRKYPDIFSGRELSYLVKFDQKEEFTKKLKTLKSDDKVVGNLFLTTYQKNPWFFDEMLNQGFNRFDFIDENQNSLLNLTLYNNDTETAYKLIDNINDRSVFTRLNKNGENAIIIASKMMLFDIVKKIKERMVKLS